MGPRQALVLTGSPQCLRASRAVAPTLVGWFSSFKDFFFYYFESQEGVKLKMLKVSSHVKSPMSLNF